MAAGRIAFFDCYSGASGDMILGSLVDAGLDLSHLRDALAALPVAGFELSAEPMTRHGLVGTHLRVMLAQKETHPRYLAEIEHIIESSALSERVKGASLGVFRRLGEVEAHVHGIPVEEVHFHEVGAVDAIVDIVGAAIGMEALDLDGVYASALPMGRGSVETAHGRLPLPAPATLELLAGSGAVTYGVDLEAELVTPTGAAILVTLAEFRQPQMTIDRIGLGFGTRELPWANALRVWLGTAAEAGLEVGEVTVIETNLDDCTPEQAGFAMERLLAAGALDVFFTPIQMKKNRPSVLLTVMCLPVMADSLARIVLRETTSLGVRYSNRRRLMCPRLDGEIETAFGTLRVKIKIIDGQEIVCPEYEECARVARERSLPLGDVYAAVVAAGQLKR
ncbi:MAG: larC [Chloroflexi bacterium]|nr:larC [Chloroflexota bacterium]